MVPGPLLSGQARMQDRAPRSRCADSPFSTAGPERAGGGGGRPAGPWSWGADVAAKGSGWRGFSSPRPRGGGPAAFLPPPASLSQAWEPPRTLAERRTLSAQLPFVSPGPRVASQGAQGWPRPFQAGREPGLAARSRTPQGRGARRPLSLRPRPPSPPPLPLGIDSGR